ncbi:MAG: pyrroline-5-carboxylate reductase [Balneolales bacterium]|nr:pyrroline-5-carboxylate reductase [Balneolales bacterium]
MIKDSQVQKENQNQDNKEVTAYQKGTIAIIGAGKLGEAIIEATIGADFFKPSQILVTNKRKESSERLKTRFGVQTSTNEAAVREARVILLAVKPQMAKNVLQTLKPLLRIDQLLISVMAGVTVSQLKEWSGNEPAVIRAMPNTPLRIRKGMSAICGCDTVPDEAMDFAEHLFATAGRVLRMDEQLFDAVTGLSASGPAFIYIMIEALAEGGVKAGIPRHLATELAAQTCLGAASMVLETGKHPAVLKDEVTTPAGCTIDGILKLEEGGIRVTLIKAVEEAARKAAALGGK